MSEGREFDYEAIAKVAAAVLRHSCVTLSWRDATFVSYEAMKAVKEDLSLLAPPAGKAEPMGKQIKEAGVDQRKAEGVTSDARVVTRATKAKGKAVVNKAKAVKAKTKKGKSK